MRYEIVRDVRDYRAPLLVLQQVHPEQPADGFATAMEANVWSDTPPRQLGGEWYIRPVEDTK